MIRVYIEPALSAYQLLMLQAEPVNELIRMLLAENKNLPCLLGDLISHVFIDLEGHRLIEALRGAMVTAAERAFEVTFFDYMFVICFNHIFLDAVLAGCGATAVQDYWLSPN